MEQASPHSVVSSIQGEVPYIPQEPLLEIKTAEKVEKKDEKRNEKEDVKRDEEKVEKDMKKEETPTNEPIDIPPYNTLVIAGGASKCISAIGSLHYLFIKGELDFIENYAGTSAGALLCYLMCIGYSPFEIIHFLCKTNFIEEFQSLNLAGILEQKGLVNYYIIQEYLEKLTVAKLGYVPTFRDLRNKLGKNLVVVSYNMTRNKAEYIGPLTYPDMPCLVGLRMTISVPLLFERFWYNSCEFLDGGLVDNFPITHFDTPENKTIAININPHDTTPATKQSYITYLLKIAMIPYVFFNTRRKYSERCTVININTEIQTFDFSLSISRRLDLFSKGYQITKHFFEDPKE